MSNKDAVLSRVFTNAETIIDELSAESGEFNSQDFLRRVMRDQPEAYIDLLVLEKKLTILSKRHIRASARC